MTQQERDQAQAEKVDGLLNEAKALGVTTTRRQARKALQGRGSLMAKLASHRQSQDDLARKG